MATSCQSALPPDAKVYLISENSVIKYPKTPPNPLIKKTPLNPSWPAASWIRAVLYRLLREAASHDPTQNGSLYSLLLCLALFPHLHTHHYPKLSYLNLFI